MLSFFEKRIFFNERENRLKKLSQFLTTMPRGRPKKTNKLTNAERCRRSRKKEKKKIQIVIRQSQLSTVKNIITRIRTKLSLGSKLRKIHC